MTCLLTVVLILVAVLILPSPGYGAYNLYTRIKSTVTGNPGLPLILTPVINAGNISQAQIDCKNKPFKSNITSYSGFLTVNRRYNSNMFFWFFPAIQNNETAPIILWLQGGPGATSLLGVFSENGPFSVKNRHGLKLRKHTWITSHSVLYIDNPVGTGFSFTDEGGYSTNEVDIGANLYTALVQFFTLFPQYQKNDFYIAGESYAGKFVPAVAFTIDSKNPSARLKINLKGLAIGNGLCDPEHMLNYGDYFYQIGLLDGNGRNLFHNKERSILAKIQQKKWAEAYSEFDSLLIGETSKSPSLFQTLTGFQFYFNYLHTQDYDPSSDMGRYLGISDIRKNLHVGNQPFNNDVTKVQQKMTNDIMQSVKPWMEILLEKYRVLIYSGQLDIITPFPLTESFLDSLNWSGSSSYRSAPRKQWFVGEDLAGYSKVARKLTVVLVRNAGHMVPMDQPEWAIDLISRFTRNRPF